MINVQRNQWTSN